MSKTYIREKQAKIGKHSKRELTYGIVASRLMRTGKFRDVGTVLSVSKFIGAFIYILSPIYKNGTRGGCWFCPNCRYSVFKRLRNTHPDLWDELLQLGKTPNLTSYGFKYGLTIEQVNERLDAMDAQLTLF